MSGNGIEADWTECVCNRKKDKSEIIFASSLKYVCFRFSLEVSHRGISNEYLQHMFLWRSNKEFITELSPNTSP